MTYYELKIESSEGEIVVNEKNVITFAEVVFETNDKNTKTKSNAILAQMTVRGIIVQGLDISINEQAMKFSEWARDLKNSTTYRNVTLTVKNDEDESIVRIYKIPAMFVCDYKETFNATENNAFTFELKLNQSANKLNDIKIYQ